MSFKKGFHWKPFEGLLLATDFMSERQISESSMQASDAGHAG